MIIRLQITLPFDWFKNNSEGLQIGFVRHGKVSTHKFWEIQVVQLSLANLFEFELDLRGKGEDHAGYKINLTILGLMFAAQIYDHRHWNYEKDRWYEAGEETAYEYTEEMRAADTVDEDEDEDEDDEDENDQEPEVDSWLKWLYIVGFVYVAFIGLMCVFTDHFFDAMFSAAMLAWIVVNYPKKRFKD